MSAKAEMSAQSRLDILKTNDYLKNCTHWIDSYSKENHYALERIKLLRKTLKAAKDNISLMESIIDTEFKKAQL